jgi:hypothetical protein
MGIMADFGCLPTITEQMRAEMKANQGRMMANM